MMPVPGAQNGRDAYRIGAVRVDDGPVIDGVLDEAVWKTAAVIDQCPRPPHPAARTRRGLMRLGSQPKPIPHLPYHAPSQ
ncbi:MAG: hypothetical protein HYV20_13795 [Gemmatimonadetes bacterium]|nr:hypothetical protein [Gemmatimonadota bacterium]